MNIIILILMALGYLSGPDQYTEAYQQSHGTEISQASSIYANHQYVISDGVVIIDTDVNPQ